MSQKNPEMPSRVDQILDLLLDALLERQRARGGRGFQPPVAVGVSMEPESEPPVSEPEAVDEIDALEDIEEIAPDLVEEPLPPLAPVPTGQMGRALVRLAVALLIFVVVVNVPITRYGVSLARVMPDSAALIIRDGLLLKGQNSDEIYVLQDDRLRWISSLEAFERLHYRWQNVHVVEDSFLEKFEKGRPVHVLLKCNGSPHIYRIEREQKRWIKDIPTFEAEGHVWEDVNFVSCQYLRNLPDGPPIPEDAGPPPQP